MATTTNFGWETPDDTDLVKDGAAAIRTALGGVDTSFVDLKGGTTGQLLSKASNTDLDFSWAAPNASGLKLITRQSFSAVANTGTTFDSIFSATYKSYLVVIENISAATVGNDLHCQFRNGTTTLASDYYGAQFGVDYNSSSLTINNTNNLAHMLLTAEMSPGTSLTFYASGVGGTTTTASIQGTGIDRAKPTAINYAIGYFGASTTVDGLIFKSSSSNITGTIAIYGLATS